MKLELTKEEVEIALLNYATTVLGAQGFNAVEFKCTGYSSFSSAIISKEDKPLKAPDEQ